MKFSRHDYNGRIVDLENKIPLDEPCFLLRSKDKLAPKLLLMWAMELRLQGGDPNMAAEAENWAQEMIEWQKTHEVKTPDQYNDSPEKQFILSKIKTIIQSINEGKYITSTEISNWLTKYYGDVKGLYYILMPSDLIESSKNKSIDDLVFEDFKVSDEDTLEMLKSKLILFYGQSRVRILKCNI